MCINFFFITFTVNQIEIIIATQPTTQHHGNNVRIIRGIHSMKQIAFALQLGPNWSQKKVSILENTKVLNAEQLKCVSEAFQIPEELITDYSPNKILSCIQNNPNEPKQLNPYEMQDYREVVKLLKAFRKLLVKYLKAINKKMKSKKYKP